MEVIEEKILEDKFSPLNQSVISLGKVVAISISKKKGIPKTNVQSAKLIENFGIEGDIHGGKWHRQVSFLALESIDKMREKGLPNLRPGAFAENITTEFLELPKLEIGTRMKIGKEAELEITQIGKECHSKCAIFIKVGDCVMPREGIFAKVIRGGEIFIEDEIQILSATL
ncbi:MOSC domain-containing protein [Melioribacteraceae bacterium 09-Me]|uniref:MOSC domain-containing protein n=1 Tax=Stygiobacter electus TaxID=3032292 RepID=A0AAE3TE79_9BACT|nr:MOSC domain-containing protein [Stygiobacter electus]MDF1613261.1 MOSC domain-containing protein [Stygiobacter electus]